MAIHTSILPGKSHGQRSLMGYSPWGSKESDTTEQLSMHADTSIELSLKVLPLTPWKNWSPLLWRKKGVYSGNTAHYDTGNCRYRWGCRGKVKPNMTTDRLNENDTERWNTLSQNLGFSLLPEYHQPIF